MRNYLDLLYKVLATGEEREDRTGTGTRSLFGEQLKFDLDAGFPLVTTKKVPFRLVAAELLWMLRGETNVRSLQEDNCHIWDSWADEHGNLGPIYGENWMRWKQIQVKDGRTVLGEYNQIAAVIKSLQEDPYGRRHIVSAWNVGKIHKMALPPCHAMFQFYVRNTGNLRHLDCHMYQRSADIFLGVPFNIAQYALLTHIIAYAVDPHMWAGKLTISYGDIHLYNNHVEQAEEQLMRRPKTDTPWLCWTPYACESPYSPESIVGGFIKRQQWDMLKSTDFIVEDYYPYPAIKGDVAV